MNEVLTKPFEEHVFIFMHTSKAPGPDGITALFFQKFWHIIKDDIVKAIQTSFYHGFILKFVNEILIIIIPKLESPTNLTHYRPIALLSLPCSWKTDL